MFSLAVAAVSLLSPGAGQPARSIDLFLIGGNPQPFAGLKWLESPSKTPAEAALQEKLAELDAQKKGFVVLNMGQFSLFPGRNEWMPVSYLERTFREFDSAFQSVGNGKHTRTEVVARSLSVGTGSGNLNVQQWRKKNPGYMSRNYLHFSTEQKDRAFLALQDLNSYLTILDRGTAQDRDSLDRTLLVSGDSVAQTLEVLKGTNIDYQGIGICAWGRPDPSKPNIVAFPGAGIVSHYRMTYKDGEWSIALIDYLRAPRTLAE